jgi:hypothetical protein
MFPPRSRALLLFLCALPAAAQLTPDQRAQDFRELAAAFHRFYAPANWKMEALKVNIFEISPWIARVRAARNDTEYFEIAMEFVTSLQDGHSGFQIPSNFRASLGLAVDIYDGKVLIEAISSRYPPAQFPFRVGDELVSIDGVPVNETLDRLMKLQSFGRARPTRRLAAAYLTSRPQAVVPAAHLTPDMSTVVIRRAETGAEEAYALTWLKSGQPLTALPRLPDAYSRPQKLAETAAPAAALRDQMLAWDLLMARPRMPAPPPELAGEPRATEALLGFSVRTPYYALPANFVRRRGTGNDTLFTGTFESDGQRLGLIRIPTFAVEPGPRRRAMMRELEGEITFMQANTDGLIVDVSRNEGGFCSGDVLSRMNPNPTQVYRQLLIGSLSATQAYEQALNEARLFAREPWVVDLWQFQVDSLRSASLGVRSLTGPLASCYTEEFSSYPVQVDAYPPWPGAYTKPLIVLQDELSASQAEHFAAMVQDNRRGLVVGVQSPGLGGSIGDFAGGYYGESSLSLTTSLTVRGQTVQTPGLPRAPYIESIGVIPDVVIDAMTRENLMNQFRPFFAEVTRAAVEHIRNPKTQ